jgi:hypothetical protein
VRHCIVVTLLYGTIAIAFCCCCCFCAAHVGCAEWQSGGCLVERDVRHGRRWWCRWTSVTAPAAWWRNKLPLPRLVGHGSQQSGGCSGVGRRRRLRRHAATAAAAAKAVTTCRHVTRSEGAARRWCARPLRHLPRLIVSSIATRVGHRVGCSICVGCRAARISFVLLAKGAMWRGEQWRTSECMCPDMVADGAEECKRG